MVEEKKSTKPTPMRFRAIGPVIRAAGLVPWAIAFAGLFVVASFIVSVSESEGENIVFPDKFRDLDVRSVHGPQRHSAVEHDLI